MHPAIFSRLCLLLMGLIWLPANSQTVGNNPEIVITKELAPVIANTQKFFETPVNNDTTLQKDKVQYEYAGKRLNIVYEIDPIRAANVKSDAVNRLYRNFAKGGWGNYNTPYFEFFHHTARMKNGSYGVHLRHLSSDATLKDRGYSGFSQNEAEVFGKTFLNKNTLSGSLKYNRDRWQYYGFDPKDPLFLPFDLNKENTRQWYQWVRANVDFSDNLPTDSLALKYQISGAYHNLRDRFESAENYLKLGGHLHYYYKEFKVGGLLQFENWGNRFPTDTVNNSILQIRPQGTLTKERLKLVVALNSYATFGSDGSRFNLVPEVDFTLDLFRKILVFNAGTDSRLQRNSYSQLVQDNPFINPFGLKTRNSWAPLRFYAGFSGAVTRKTYFNTQISYVKVFDQAFFVTDTSAGRRNQMTVIYDDAGLLRVTGELAYQSSEKLKLMARAEIWQFDPDAELQAWHQPVLRTTWTGRYTLGSKMVFQAQLFTFGRQFGRAFDSVTDSLGTVSQVVRAENLQGFFDFNAGAEYRYSKRLSAFLNINNLLAARYNRFYQYPTQRLNFIAGLSYAF